MKIEVRSEPMGSHYVFTSRGHSKRFNSQPEAIAYAQGFQRGCNEILEMCHVEIEVKS